MLKEAIKAQHVCTRCGFNMVGYYPKNCPFCGAPREEFITSEECSRKYHVKEIRVSKKVTRLNSYPALGYEHAAYRIDLNEGSCWIDCPSSFDQEIEPTGKIFFTHHHFLGASNLYRLKFSSLVHIHEEDAKHQISKDFTFDERFSGDFKDSKIEAFHIDGHTPGFTFYLFEDVIFVCDYVFYNIDKVKFNPYGPANKTMEGGRKLLDIIEGRGIKLVCGVDYVENFSDWREKVIKILE